MRFISRPKFDVRESYLACVSSTFDPGRRTRLQQTANAIVVASQAYETASINGAWYELPSSIQVVPASDEELKDVYARSMGSVGKSGRHIYDAIRNSQLVCPHCGQGVVKTLDHYLPKSRYPHFSVLPDNLVLCCRDCNTAKLEKWPSTFEQQTFHPYFDDLTNERWLFARAIVSGGASLEFFVAAAPGWGDDDLARATRHFEVFDLGRQFAIFAAQDISTIKSTLRRIFETGGADAVQQNLCGTADSARDAHLNSWKTATYEALADSQPFCDGGFEQIG